MTGPGNVTPAQYAHTMIALHNGNYEGALIELYSSAAAYYKCGHNIPAAFWRACAKHIEAERADSDAHAA